MATTKTIKAKDIKEMPKPLTVHYTPAGQRGKACGGPGGLYILADTDITNVTCQRCKRSKAYKQDWQAERYRGD